MTQGLVRSLIVGCMAVVVVAGLSLHAGDNDRKITARLDGFEEVPPVSTSGEGRFRAEVSKDGTQISYTLEYSGLPQTPTAAHIHFGQRAVSGGVIAFLCGGGAKPSCPASGPVSGTIIAADVLGPAAQGIGVTELNEVLRAIQAGSVYVNVHTVPYPAGEIRGQLEMKGRNDDHDDDDDDE